jgi:hypothetical protein
MRGRWRSALRVVAGLILAAGGCALIWVPETAPGWVLGGLMTAACPLAVARRAAWGTELRAALAWGTLAVVLGAVSQGMGLGEPLAGGRPGTGHWAYLSALATLAALISVFNARRPGGGAWALLMALLVLVFLIPWLEGWGLAWGGARRGRLWLEAPWSWFFGMLAIAGSTNYLPTRYGPASAWLGLGLGLELAALTWPDGTLARRGITWSAFPWSLAVAAWTAEICSHRDEPGTTRLHRLWFPFRDHWGVVWALRVEERFNRSAEATGWPIRLAWDGLVPAPGAVPGTSPPEAAEETLKGLLRRFATEARISSWEGVAGESDVSEENARDVAGGG